MPWRSDFEFEGTPGWFRCPYHGATFTKYGVRIFGPAFAGLFTMTVTIDENGVLWVDTGARKLGDVTNPQRAIRPPA